MIFPCLFFVSFNANATPELTTSSTLSTAGYLQLSWTSDSSGNELQQYVLQQSTSPDFDPSTTLYQGPDQSTVISGLADNTYYYRVRQLQQDTWSEPVKVEVKHHSLTRAFGFFALGAFMFVMTVGVLLNRARGQR